MPDGYADGMRFKLEKRYKDGRITHEPFETPHDYRRGDPFVHGNVRWLVVDREGTRLVAEQAPG